MTRFSRKCVWIIALVVFAIAVIIFLGWGSKGFRYWDTSEWFNRWGKGKPAVARVVEPPADQQAMALMSANSDIETYSAASDFEVILDSADGITTFATEKLPVPELSLASSDTYLVILFSGSTVPAANVGNVTLFIAPLIDEYSNADTYKVIELTKFTKLSSGGIRYTVKLSSLYSELKTLFAKPKYIGQADGNLDYCFGLFAQCVSKNANYFSSDNSNILYFQPHARELSSEYTTSEFKLKCDNVFKTGVNFKSAQYEFAVCSSLDADVTPLITFIGNDYVNDHMWAGYYSSSGSNYYGVNLLTLADKLSKKPASDIYYFVFKYMTFTYACNSKTYTVVPFVSTSSKLTSSFVINRLATPSNFVFDNGTLTWDPVEGATQYGVFWTEGETEKQVFVDSPSYAFDVQALGEGTHTVRVRALGNMAQTAVDNGQTASITAYNASNVITQVVSLTYNVDGDTVTKFVPVGSKMSDNTYEVKVQGKEFGGWFYDSGFSREVKADDMVDKDMTIYARLSDKKVMERKATWWDENMWYVIGGIIGLVGVGVIIAVAVGLHKRKVKK